MREMLLAVILGFVEGLTEFLPVSSTGHLILVGDSIGFNGERASSFQIVIQLGAIIAVVFLYWGRFVALTRNGAGDGFGGWQGLTKLALVCLPAFVVGFLFHKTIKLHLFNSPSVSMALIAGALLMLWIEARKGEPTTRSLGDISHKQAVLIGVAQCASLWPGFSRSGATILGGMLLGVERRVAAEFSFIAAVPLLAVATGYEFLKSYHLFTRHDLVILGIGFAVSFISAIAAVKFFISLLSRWTLRPFAYYRLVLGVVVLTVWTLSL